MPLTTPHIGIDFGLSNTDVVIATAEGIDRRSSPAGSATPLETVQQLIDEMGDEIPRIAVSGGKHRDLPERLGAVTIGKINEVDAIGRGGQALIDLDPSSDDRVILVVSAGSGTAMIRAAAGHYQHVSGTAVGGGTLMGLGRLLLKENHPLAIDRLAVAGRRTVLDLQLYDVISGSIGDLKSDSTAVNFGRLAREQIDAQPADIAASLVTMIAQTIALIAINSARAFEAQRIVFTGHLIDLAAMRKAISAVGDLYGVPLELPSPSGHATALGAMLMAR